MIPCRRHFRSAARGWNGSFSSDSRRGEGHSGLLVGLGSDGPCASGGISLMADACGLSGLRATRFRGGAPPTAERLGPQTQRGLVWRWPPCLKPDSPSGLSPRGSRRGESMLVSGCLQHWALFLVFFSSCGRRHITKFSIEQFFF